MDTLISALMADPTHMPPKVSPPEGTVERGNWRMSDCGVPGEFPGTPGKSGTNAVDGVRHRVGGAGRGEEPEGRRPADRDHLVVRRETVAFRRARGHNGPMYGVIVTALEGSA